MLQTANRYDAPPSGDNAWRNWMLQVTALTMLSAGGVHRVLDESPVSAQQPQAIEKKNQEPPLALEKVRQCIDLLDGKFADREASFATLLKGPICHAGFKLLGAARHHPTSEETRGRAIILFNKHEPQYRAQIEAAAEPYMRVLPTIADREPWTEGIPEEYRFPPHFAQDAGAEGPLLGVHFFTMKPYKMDDGSGDYQSYRDGTIRMMKAWAVSDSKKYYGHPDFAELMENEMPPKQELSNEMWLQNEDYCRRAGIKLPPRYPAKANPAVPEPSHDQQQSFDRRDPETQAIDQLRGLHGRQALRVLRDRSH